MMFKLRRFVSVWSNEAPTELDLALLLPAVCDRKLWSGRDGHGHEAGSGQQLAFSLSAIWMRRFRLLYSDSCLLFSGSFELAYH